MRSACYVHLNPVIFSHFKLYWWRIKNLEALIVSFSPSSRFFVSPECTRQGLFSGTVNLRSSLIVRDNVPHIYKRTDEIFSFLDSTQKDKGIWTEQQEALPPNLFCCQRLRECNFDVSLSFPHSQRIYWLSSCYGVVLHSNKELLYLEQLPHFVSLRDFSRGWNNWCEEGKHRVLVAKLPDNRALAKSIR